MVNDPRSSDANTEGSRVDIGEIEGGIHNSTIAGRDVNQTNIAGNAETGGGDFVGHDKHVQGDEVHGDQNVVQVGGNAQNVAAGKNIIQIGSIKVSLYLAVLIAVCMIGIILSLFFVARRLAIIGSAMTAPTATPTFTPTPLPIPTPTYMPMSGAVYGIAIAQFGQLDAQGHIQQTQEASNLSQMLADSLQHAFEAAGTDGEFKVQFRYDTADAPPGDRPIGVIVDTVHAEQIRRELNAKLLIYGYLTADQPRKLQLGFVFTTKRMQTEPDATVGYQRLGAPVVFEPAGQSMEMEEFENNPELAWRIQAIIWLTRGLARDLVGNHAKALETFLQAAHQLKAWQNEDGKEVLYYFQGREALALLEKQGPFGLAEDGQSWTILQGQEAQDAIQAGEARPLQRLALAASAFLTATQINPDYVTAYIGLGNVYFHRGQFALLAGQPATAGIAACTPELSVPQIQNSEELTVTPTGAIREIDQAIRYYEMAVNKAPKDVMSPMLPVAQVMRGYSYALKGMAFLLENEQEPQVERLDQAKTALIRATGEMSATLQPFTEQQQFDFVAFGYYGLGEANRALAYLHAQQQHKAEAHDLYLQAHDNYGKCYALEDTPNPDGNTELQKMIGCYCRAWDDNVIEDLTKLGGGNG